MISKILKSISDEHTLRILNLISYKKEIKENDLVRILDIPRFEIHKHLRELINLNVILDQDTESETIYRLNLVFMKKYNFLKILLEELRNENLYFLDLKNIEEFSLKIFKLEKNVID